MTPKQISPRLQTFIYKRAANTITRFIQNTVLRRSETLQNRINYYKSIQYYLKNVPFDNCLTPKVFKDTKGNVTNGFELDSTLKLIKQIGSKSVYGAVYQTAARSNILSVATKLMPANNRNKQEVILNTTTTQLVINKITRHFLISYKTFKCNVKSNNTTFPNIIRNQNYYISMNELAHGDLKQLCYNAMFLADDEIVCNIGIQCLLAIYTFHKLNYSHNDCHWGNFLYQKTKDSKGYYHYQIDGKNYYLKNCGYNMMIYDFGLSKIHKKPGHYRRTIEDYRLILNAFIKYTDGGIIDMGSVPHSRISKYMNSINNLLIDVLVKNIPEDTAFNQYMIPTFLSSPISGLFVETIPANEIVVNKNPFYIDKNIYMPVTNPFTSPLQTP